MPVMIFLRMYPYFSNDAIILVLQTPIDVETIEEYTVMSSVLLKPKLRKFPIGKNA
jgi:hypothetical protein